MSSQHHHQQQQQQQPPPSSRTAAEHPPSSPSASASASSSPPRRTAPRTASSSSSPTTRTGVRRTSSFDANRHDNGSNGGVADRPRRHQRRRSPPSSSSKRSSAFDEQGSFGSGIGGAAGTRAATMTPNGRLRTFMLVGVAVVVATGFKYNQRQVQVFLGELAPSSSSWPSSSSSSTPSSGIEFAGLPPRRPPAAAVVSRENATEAAAAEEEPGSDDNNNNKSSKSESNGSRKELPSSSLPPQPQPPSSSKSDVAQRDDGDSFSACLLLMDDNHRLPEWLAYHYYALSLRHLVVAVDPHSKTSPSDVLDRWRDRMTIELWVNDTFTKEDLIIRDTDSQGVKTIKHRKRQGKFYQACVGHLKGRNRTWTAFHDVDEFITVNGDTVKDAAELARAPGSVLDVVRHYRETPYGERRNDVPELWYEHFNKTACVPFARILVGATESSPEEISKGVPPFLDPLRFDTLRWRYRHSKRGNSDGLAKSIIDVSRVGPKDYGTHSAHRPLKRICPGVKFRYDTQPLGIYHYIGSWEQYNFRDDARGRPSEVWKQKALKKSGGVDDLMRHWISGFVDMVGEEAAKRLLADQGLPPDNSTLPLSAGDEKKPDTPAVTAREEAEPADEDAASAEEKEEEAADSDSEKGEKSSTSDDTAENDTAFEDKDEPAEPSTDGDDDTPTVSSFVSSNSSSVAMGQNNDDSFSACLLVMDDNYRLPEWIAYHYFSLPLRYLVVTVDPHSKTSPSKILDQWRDRMTIVEWTDSNFTKKDLIIKASDSAERRTAKHRNRQGLFYHACVRHLQQQERSWTAFIDVDEFLAINGDSVKGAKGMVAQPANVLPVVKTYAETAAENRSKDVPGYWYDHFQETPCVLLPRALVSAVPSNSEAMHREVPSAIDPMRFDTLRWRFRHSKRGRSVGPGKSILDVSRVGPDDFGGINAHRPLMRICHQKYVFIAFSRVPLGIYHYLGSWEAYSFREDARDGSNRSYEKWKEKALKADGGADDLMRHWIGGFVDMVGEDTAKRLFEGQGLPPGLKHNSTLASARRGLRRPT